MKLFNDLLERSGHATLRTKSGVEAIALAREHHPDLILMDIQLPEVSGLEVTRWIKDDGSARHDYLYSRAELAAAVPEIRRLEQESERVLVLMNNPWRGQAVINARMLLELLI